MTHSTLEAYLTDQEGKHLEKVYELLRIPSISALSEHKEDMAAAARWLVSYLKDVGFPSARVMETEKHPLVYAEWMETPGAPTALIYGHYDVQPVDPLHLWESQPFEPTLRDGRIYARGSSDDKGQVMAHIQALEALLATGQTLPVNVKLLIEGEEEVGSPSLGSFIAGNKELLRADVLVISDTSMYADGLPTICCGLRGLAGMEVHVTTAATDLHSGLYGGAVANATHVLAELLAGVRQGQGRITIPGFYDEVEELEPEERRQMNALPFDEDEYAERLGVAALAGESGYSAVERLSVRPTLEVNGMWGGFQGEGSKTVIPNEAHAKITCRLVPNQDPHRIQRIVSEYFETQCPESAKVRVELGHTANPWKCSPDSPYVQAGVRALEATFGRSVALARMGGTIPVVETFHSLLGLPCVLMGFAAPDSNAHAPNESLPLENFRLARNAVGRFWQELAAVE